MNVTGRSTPPPVQQSVIIPDGDRGDRKVSGSSSVGGGEYVPVISTVEHSGGSVESLSSNSKLVDDHSLEGVIGKASA